MGIDITNIFLYHGLVIFGELLVISVFMHMLYKKRQPAGIIAWLLFMILAPYIAVFLYLVFGFRKRENRYKKKLIELQKPLHTLKDINPIHSILKGYGIPDTMENGYFELITDSIKAYEKLLESIKNSKKSIYISIYIFQYDEIGKELIQELIKKAKEGVDVKILIDSMGSIELYFMQYKLRKLREAGAKVEFFMPIFEMPLRNYINLRNHRKIFMFDNRIVLGGGINISNDYFGKVKNKERWKDILFLSEGTSTELFFEIFASDWFYASDEKIEFVKNEGSRSGDAFLQVVPSGPDMEKDVLYEALLCAIYSAKNRIWIVTPYFIPDNSIIQALRIAKNKGIDVKLITPKESNHFVVNLARSSYMRELNEIGAEVALYNGAMLHAKAILFDDSTVMLGSVNLDNRSLFLNYEVATFVYSSKAIEDVETWMKSLLKNSSTGMKPIFAPRVILENIIRIVAPQL